MYQGDNTRSGVASTWLTANLSVGCSVRVMVQMTGHGRKLSMINGAQMATSVRPWCLSCVTYARPSHNMSASVCGMRLTEDRKQELECAMR